MIAGAALGQERPDHVQDDRVVDFDIFNPPGIDEVGFQLAWKRLQDEAPHEIVWTPRNEGHWIVLRSKLVRKVYRDFNRFSSTAGINVPKSESVEVGLIPTMYDPPLHSAFREVFNKAFASLLGDPHTAVMARSVAVSAIEAFVPHGQCEFMRDYSKPFAIGFFLGLMNLPFSDADRLKGLVDQMTRPDGSMSFEQIRGGLYAYADPIIEARLGGDGKDLVSLIINGPVDGEPMTHSQMRGTIALLITAGVDTVVNTLGFFFEFLARNPGHRRQITEDAAVLPRAVEELLRRFPVIAECRMARDDMEWEGVSMKAGEMVCAPTVLANLDEEANGCPVHVDFARKRPSHQTFGEGVHLCVGQGLARLQLGVSIEEWLKRIPEFSVAAGERVRHVAGSVATVEELPLTWPV